MKERWDFAEVEFKFLPTGEAARPAEIVRSSLPPRARLAQLAPITFFDLYLDTESRELYRRRHSFRIRFDARSFRKSGRYKCNFKAPLAQEDPHVLTRREVRTDLRLAEIVPLPSTSLPGLAAELAYEAARGGSATRPRLHPVLLISSMRRQFTVQAAEDGEPDLMLLTVERSWAYDARSIDIEPALRKGVVGWMDPPPTVTFELGELELTVEGSEAADEAFGCAVQRLRSTFSTTTTTKYAALVEHFSSGRGGTHLVLDVEEPAAR